MQRLPVNRGGFRPLDESLEARIAPERIPFPAQAQMSERNTLRGRRGEETRKQVDRLLHFTGLPKDKGQICLVDRAADRILLFRAKFNRSLSFANRFLLPPEHCENLAQRRVKGRIVRMVAHALLVQRCDFLEKRPCLFTITSRDRNGSFIKRFWFRSGELVERAIRDRSFRGRKIARQHPIIPYCYGRVSFALPRLWQTFQHRARDRRIAALGKLHVGKTDPAIEQLGLDLRGFSVSIARSRPLSQEPQSLWLAVDVRLPGIKLPGARERGQRLPPVTLPSIGCSRKNRELQNC